MLQLVIGRNRREERHAGAEVSGVGWLGWNSKTSGRGFEPLPPCLFRPIPSVGIHVGVSKPVSRWLIQVAAPPPPEASNSNSGLSTVDTEPCYSTFRPGPPARSNHRTSE